MFPSILERLEAAFSTIEGPSQTDSHLNEVSIEYPESDVLTATRDFDNSVLLGTGTFGSVYKGTMRDGTEVAIKALTVPEEAGFEEEVQVLSRFRHPNLVILMGFARHKETGGRSLIYEYLAGGDVSKRLQRSRQGSEPFGWRLRLSASLDAARGLSHLHNLPVRAFHRDIKGPNILLDKNGTAKMADFGLSCVSQTSQHKVAQASGTVGYACPVYIKTGMITEGSEVHSFGMVLLEVLTGAPPAVQRPDKPTEFCYLVEHLQGSSAMVRQMLDPTAQFPPALVGALTDIAFRCIASQPESRPLFCRLVEELRQLVDEKGWQEASVPASTSVPLPARGLRPLQPCAAPGATGPVGAGVGYTGGAGVASAGGPGTLAANGNAHLLPAVPAGLIAGQIVEARWRGNFSWFRGRIMRVNANGTFAVRYDEKDCEDSVPAHFIRLPESTNTKGPEHVASAHGDSSTSPRQQLQRAQAAEPPLASLLPAAVNGSLGISKPLNLWCTFADGVDLDSLPDRLRCIVFPRGAAELVVGRTAQPSVLWETLVPDKRLHGTVSREHLKILGIAQPGAEQPSYTLVCLSQNGLLLNGNFLRPVDGPLPLREGDVIMLAACPSVSTVTASRKAFIAFRFDSRALASDPGDAAANGRAAHGSSPVSHASVSPVVSATLAPSARLVNAGASCGGRPELGQPLSPAGPRRLPSLEDDHDAERDGGGPVVERSHNGLVLASSSIPRATILSGADDVNTVSGCSAGALRPPVVDLDEIESPAGAGAVPAMAGIPRVVSAGDDDEGSDGVDEDDLFAKTGFESVSRKSTETDAMDRTASALDHKSWLGSPGKFPF